MAIELGNPISTRDSNFCREQFLRRNPPPEKIVNGVAWHPGFTLEQDRLVLKMRLMNRWVLVVCLGLATIVGAEEKKDQTPWGEAEVKAN